MRFYHIADTHLGATPDESYPWAQKRKEEIWQSFREVISRAEKEQIDLLLIAGDLFHRQPLLRELKELNYLFSALRHTKVVFITGNHDYLKRDSHYRDFPWNKNVICLGKETCEKIVLPELHTAIYGFSYHRREIREPLYDNLKPENDGFFSILLAHGGDEKHIPINKRKLLSAGFGYIALGHIHKPQIIERNRMAYAGALEPLDKNDLGPHGFISGSQEDGHLQIQFIPWAVRDYRRIELEITEQDTDFYIEEQIKKEIQESGTQHIYRVHLTGFRDPDIVFQTERYSRLGNIIEVVDDTEPSYDFETLLCQHEDDIIGGYIRKLYRANMSQVEKKALYYGVQALMEVKK